MLHCCGSSSHGQPAVTSQSESVPYPDSGATNHITPDVSGLTNTAPYASTSHVTMGNGASISITNVGSSTLLTGTRLLKLQNVLHVPAVCKNLMSVGQFAKDNGVYFEFHPFLCFVNDIQTGMTLLEGHMHEGLYWFQFTTPTPVAAPSPLKSSSKLSSTLVNSAQLSSTLWHDRLGHPCSGILTRVLRSCNFPYKQNVLSHVCNRLLFFV